MNTNVGWDYVMDMLVGFCGEDYVRQCLSIAGCRKERQCDRAHQCDPNTADRIGAIGDSYETIKKAFENFRKAKHARAIVLNPMDARNRRWCSVYTGPA